MVGGLKGGKGCGVGPRIGRIEWLPLVAHPPPHPPHTHSHAHTPHTQGTALDADSACIGLEAVTSSAVWALAPKLIKAAVQQGGGLSPVVAVQQVVLAAAACGELAAAYAVVDVSGVVWRGVGLGQQAARVVDACSDVKGLQWEHCLAYSCHRRSQATATAAPLTHSLMPLPFSNGHTLLTKQPASSGHLCHPAGLLQARRGAGPVCFHQGGRPV